MTDRPVSVRRTALASSATRLASKSKRAVLRHGPLLLFMRTSVNFARPFRKLAGLLIVLGACAAAFGASTTALAAQAAPVPRAVALTKVDLVNESATESHFQLTLQPTANPFQALANDPRDPALALALASRTSSAVAPRSLKGLVRSIQFVQAEGVLVLHFIVNTNAAITASRNGDQLIDVVVSTGAAPGGNKVDATLSNGGGGAQYYGPPQGQGGYQLVLLKYADVSEVVGMLT